ncbi:uncharacterized protein LOC131232419, partial [Magnolia sinica]|uniref:uncharacterized protein LOC131232419 n=1 Tax=Magnolia sinica TaxID=86752 RepID=UPI002659C9D7
MREMKEGVQSDEKGRDSGFSSRKPKVIETKKEKKRRLILSSSDDDDDDSSSNHGKVANQNGNCEEIAAVDHKRRRMTDPPFQVKKKKNKTKDSVILKTETLRLNKKKPSDVSDPHVYREDDEIDTKITEMNTSRGEDANINRRMRLNKELLFKCSEEKNNVSDPFAYRDDDDAATQFVDRKRVLGVQTEKRIKSTFGFKGDAETNRKKLKIKEEKSSDISRGSWDLGSKLLGPTCRRRDGKMDCSRSSMVDKRTPPSNLPRDGSVLAVERKRRSIGFDRKRFRLEKDENFRSVGVSRDKDGKSGVLKSLPSNNKMKVDGFEKRDGQRRIAEDCRKDCGSANAPPCQEASFSGEDKIHEETGSSVVTEKKNCAKQQLLKNRVDGAKNKGSDRILRMGLKKKAEDVSKEEKRWVVVERKERGQKRGRAEEKQLLRERIKSMLVSAGWTIDSRQRSNRDYKDLVYIAPAGREYWSILNAYYALQKQLNCEGGKDGAGGQKKLNGTKSLLPVIPVEVLSILQRNTVKKAEKQQQQKKKKKKKKKQQLKGDKASVSTKEATKKDKCIKETTIGGRMKKDKPNSRVAQEGKSLKGRIKENGLEKKGFVRNVIGRRNGETLLNKQGNSAGSRLKETLESVRTRKPSCKSNDTHSLQESKHERQRGCTLLVRSSSEGASADNGNFVAYAGKRTVLSWLIDSGTVPENVKVQYMNKRRTRAMLKGFITSDGIHCSCCSKILTVSKFEIHAGSKLCQPFQNIYVESGISLLQCQLDAWNKQEESERRGFHFIDLSGDDPNDDTCGICGDGGDLICCDGCPSTFHLRCLNIQMLPPGDWHCPKCSCRFCGAVCSSSQGDSSRLFSCSQCEEKYHQGCIRETDVIPVEPNSPCLPFCELSCEKLFKHLQKLLGVKNELEAGFSWTLLRRFDEGSDASPCRLAQRVECNSKLAVALAVMDECFFPIIDQRSGFNMIRNVLYNCGSNFNRLSYSGFYTAILEKGDEIISAASIRIHGTRLAEMPFIGTRHMYRRQGMCRRLLNAIESALCSLNVEKLIIPAISELMHTWTTVFDFKPLKESHRQELRSMNLVVFPSTDMLQKALLKHDFTKGNTTASAAVETIQLKNNNRDAPEVASVASFTGLDVHACDGDIPNQLNDLEDRAAAVDAPSLRACHDSPVNTHEAPESNLQADGTVCSTSKPQEKSPESAPDVAFLLQTDDVYHGSPDGENQSLVSGKSMVHDTDEGKVEDAALPNGYGLGEGSWHTTAEIVTCSLDDASENFQASGERALHHKISPHTTQFQDAAPAYKFQASGERAVHHKISPDTTQFLDAASAYKFQASGEILQDQLELVQKVSEAASAS